DPIPLHERAQPHGILQLRLLLEGEADDLEASAPVLLVQLAEKRGFVVAVRTPAARDADDDDLALELVVGVRHQTTAEVWEAEAERLGRILHAREARWIARLRQPLRPRLVRADGGERIVLVLHDRQCPVTRWRELEAQRPGAREVAQHEPAVPVRTGERPRVAVHPEDRRGRLGAGLSDDQLPRSLAFRALSHLNVPETRNRRNRPIAERQ